MRLLLGTLLAFVLGLAGCTKKAAVDDKDNTLYLEVNAHIKTMDPIYTNDFYSNKILGNVYEKLLHYNYLKRPLVLEPQLADGMPKVSKDGLTHTFKIKKGVLFHDDPAFKDGKGRELVAQDFVYAWKRLSDQANRSDGFWIFDGKIKGLNEWRDKMAKGEADYDTPIEGLQTPDNHTLIIKLNKPYYQLHYVLAMTYAAPMAKEAAEKYGKELVNHTIGTGPFHVQEWIRKNKVTLVRNPNYRTVTYPTEGAPGDKEAGLLEDAGKKLPFLDKVVVHEIIEGQPRWLKFMKADLDVANIPKDNFDSAVVSDQVAEDLAKKGVSLYKFEEADVVYTAFNMDDPVLGKNLNLRKAIAHAYDSETYIKKFYNGRALVAHSPIPPAVDAYDPEFKNPHKTYDLAKAKEYLAKAGFPNGQGAPELEYSSTSSTTARQIAEYFKQSMAKIGLKVKIVTSSWPQFTEKIRTRKAQLWGIAWLADYPDAENFLQLLYGGNVSPGPNGSNFVNAKFDKLYEKAAKTAPGPARTKLYQEMRDIAVKEMPWMPNAHRLGYQLKYSWVKNYKFINLIDDYFKYVRIDPKERAEKKAKF